jgi:hypothetical protein
MVHDATGCDVFQINPRDPYSDRYEATVQRNVRSGSTAVEDEPLLVSADRDPADRTIDRLLAKLGLLDDAAPLVRDCEHPACRRAARTAGADAPWRRRHRARGLWLEARRYGLRTTVVALVFFALLRIKCPEEKLQ